jgi:hypothetical protein
MNLPQRQEKILFFSFWGEKSFLQKLYIHGVNNS